MELIRTKTTLPPSPADYWSMYWNYSNYPFPTPQHKGNHIVDVQLKMLRVQKF